MSWRKGSELFSEIWPLIQSKITDKDHRVEFTSLLLNLFVSEDMDPWEVEDIHPEIRQAMRLAGIDISEPERYDSDEAK